MKTADSKGLVKYINNKYFHFETTVAPSEEFISRLKWHVMKDKRSTETKTAGNDRTETTVLPR
jgi:hypothetical protein